MKVCDVVLNSIWYDPRVREQSIAHCWMASMCIAAGKAKKKTMASGESI